MRDYKKIEAWKFSDDLTVAVCSATKGFPKEEVYGLTSQVRRAAYSVPANIAEGSRRKTKKDYLHFLYMARGSLSETEYFCHLSHRLGYLSDVEYESLAEQVNRSFARLHGLIGAVEKESGRFSRGAALITSMIALSLGRFFLRGPA